ncbi:disease resistance protein RPV1-like [Rosa rugosa]|uniref:disease resistance protein RPV1-like n=1 Tax=Rosa rugosa TaxID=74645 RepID=UPI002B411A39|nr:disease resistance protein RPV1-like [Rosa rugosa]
MKSLEFLDLSDCSNLKKFPEIAKDMKELSQLYLDGTTIRELPSSIERLQGLQLLSMRNCTSLVFLADSICNLACLEELSLTGCSKLSNIPQHLVNLESLRNLEVEGSGIKPLSFTFFKHLKTCYPSMPWPRIHDNHGSFFVDLGATRSKRKRDKQTEVRVSG